jgi:hypothetical protein
MTSILRMSRKALTTGVIVATALWSLMAAALIAPSDVSAAGCESGTLIKGSLPAVYYCGADGKRYVFTNDKAFFTWYADFNGVKIVTDVELGEIAIGGNVTYRPGKKMVKIQSDPKVYVINRGGVLRHVPDESCAETLYGSDWNKQIDDISDSFFVNYKVGSPLATCSDFDKSGEMDVSVSVNIDKNLTGAIVLPAVSSVTPAAGATGVAVDADVSATFSKKMKASTLSDSTFTLTKSASGSTAVAGAVTVSEQTATFDPTASLEANTTYRATITAGVKDESDRGLSVEYSWTFTTGAAASAAPTVSSVSPADNATAVAVGADVTATFSVAMDASTLNSTTFTLTKSGTASSAVSGTVTYSGNTATFNPSANLEAGAVYAAKVTTGAKTPGGIGLSADKTWTFTTAGSSSSSGLITVTAISPPDGATGVATSTPITVTFSGPMNASTITNGTFRLKQGSSTVVAGTVSLVGNVATYTPTSPLMANTTYTVEVTSEAKDTNGSSISGGTYFWSFTTAS